MTVLQTASPPLNCPSPVSVPRRVREVLETIAAQRGVTVGEILGRGGDKRIVRARHEAMRRVRALHDGRHHSPYSYPSIGRYFNRDHTTVIAAMRT